MKRARFVARHELGDGRNVGQHRRARQRRQSQRAQPARSDELDRAWRRIEHDLDLSGEQIRIGRADAAIGHMGHAHARHHLEQFACHVDRSSNAARCHVQLVGIGLGISDEFGNGLSRDRGINLHHVGNADERRNRRDVADEIVVELVIERRIEKFGGLTSSSVYPSGSALTTASVAMLLPAPVRFST
jgi:hypothetical protein